ncbi:MAG: aminomethyl-transferring glycine dehydrogenase [Armatimonadetes bacterium]|nr:aminomethyl-transferring glycine dehydrogenase [Armatimonadota bacterium]MDE2206542.1 aminomethyl-transferring glycine dehydrogenase [Armatimonadota bacterium]
MTTVSADPIAPSTQSDSREFERRHIGPRPADVQQMLQALNLESLDDLIAAAIPQDILHATVPYMPAVGNGMSEAESLEELRDLARQNSVWTSCIGAGYSGTITPPVIQRCLIEDPRWYTPYTPYQAEVAQGRLEALLNFQQMVMDLTALPVANASLLDESTAAAEAMAMCHAVSRNKDAPFLADIGCHPQTLAVLQTRADALGLELLVRKFSDRLDEPACGILLQYPATDGAIYDYRALIADAHEHGAAVAMACDLLALTLITPPGELGADIAIGSAQRFGVPLGYGGPHAAFMAAADALKRHLPGRLVGVSRDTEDRPALRLALQTREQHIRREKATSNICTAQALLANVASMYAVWHGPEGLRTIAERTRGLAVSLVAALRGAGMAVTSEPFFDTVRVDMAHEEADQAVFRAHAMRINVRRLGPTALAVALDETSDGELVETLINVFTGCPVEALPAASLPLPEWAVRTSPFLTHPIFSSIRSESEMMRYLNRLANRDISLADSMIPLGSCTMKLNAAAEMLPITWPEFGAVHPFAAEDQARGYARLIKRLETMLCEITGFEACSLQPNAGSQGEYAGLLVIRRYHTERGQGNRDLCLIPASAHGTNPASAAMAGLRIVVVKTDADGNVDMADLRARAEEHREDLAALMITYPSTHGVFETGIREICSIVHACGGQVYMDGANMNAQVGVCRPGEIGPDVCHLNLHKTFCIPHGGGGPGMGPICVAAHLAAYLPSHPMAEVGGDKAIGAVSAAPWGSPGILPISYAYIRMMGAEGLRTATATAILNANYMAARLQPHYPVLYRGHRGLVAHECILDVRPLQDRSGVDATDVAKRLMDYGFHAPTVSFPVAGTLMIEPTESESKEEIDRYCNALIAIRSEIEEIANGTADRDDNLLKNAPHTMTQAAADNWTHPYSRERAVFPTDWTRRHKYWPPVSRVDGAYGDRNFVCACPPIEEYE